ncbi:MAG: cation:proton antiporter [Gemmatimonadota bacterium]
MSTLSALSSWFPLHEPVQVFALVMLIILFAPFLIERLRIPGMIGLILAGAVVGPDGLNLLDRDPTIVLLGTVGLLYLIFMAGVEIDLHGFRRYRRRSLVFGTISSFLPLLAGTGLALSLGAAPLGLDFSLASAILLGSVLASHTLIAYPIAIRLGISKSIPVTTAVGATIVTDTTALLILAIIAGSSQGELTPAFWVQLGISLLAYVLVILFVLPRIARWFFRHERTGGVSEYVFLLTALFSGAVLAQAAGVEPILGAFLVGLALNRFIPEQGVLMNRIHFVGNALFIPFFLLSVGMLVNFGVLAGSATAWVVMAGMTATLLATKWFAAWLSGRLFGYSMQESWLMFGLTIPQAAATLATTLIGFNLGLFGEEVLNAVIVMILVTCVAGPWVVEKYGRRVALREEQRPYEPSEAPERILVPMANPATADALMDLALLIRGADSDEAIYPLTVVPGEDERAAEHVALAEKMLSHAFEYGTGADVPVVPLTRVDHNFASGIARAIAEQRASTIVIGWDGRRPPGRRVFGSVLDQLLEQTRQSVLVARLADPLNTSDRVIVVIPAGSDHVRGFGDATIKVKTMANRLGADILALVVGEETEPYEKLLSRTRPEAPVTARRVDDWDRLLPALREELVPNDVLVIMAARAGTLAWNARMDRVPGRLAALGSNSFIMLYPSEADTAATDAVDAVILPQALRRDRVLFDLEATTHLRAIEQMIRRTLDFDEPRIQRAVERFRDAPEKIVEILRGVVVLHERTSDVREPVLVLAISEAGVAWSDGEAPAHLLFLLVTPPDQPAEHLRHLAQIVRFVGDPERAELLARSRSMEELRHPAAVEPATAEPAL